MFLVFITYILLFVICVEWDEFSLRDAVGFKYSIAYGIDKFLLIYMDQSNNLNEIHYSNYIITNDDSVWRRISLTRSPL